MTTLKRLKFPGPKPRIIPSCGPMLVALLSACAVSACAEPDDGQEATRPAPTGIAISASSPGTPDPKRKTPDSRPTLDATPWPTMTPVVADVSRTSLRVMARDQIGGTINGMAVDGDLAVLTVGNRLLTLDVGDPRSPVLVGRSDSMVGLVTDVAVHHGHAYVAVDDSIVVVDIREPRRPVLGVTLRLNDRVRGLTRVGSRLAALYQLNPVMGPAALEFIDLTDPESPTLGGFLQVVGNVDDVAVGQDSTLWTYGNETWSPGSPGIEAYAAPLRAWGGTSESRLRGIDISDPHRPAVLQTADLKLAQKDHDVHALLVSNDRLYMLGSYLDRDEVRPEKLSVYDLESYSGDTKLLGSWVGDRNVYFPDIAEWYVFEVDEHLLVVFGTTFDSYLDMPTIVVFDVSDPSKPVRSTAKDPFESHLPTSFIAARPVLQDRLLFVPWRDSLRIYDASDVRNIREVGVFSARPQLQWPVAFSEKNILWSGLVKCCDDQGAEIHGIQGYRLDGADGPTPLGFIPDMERTASIAADATTLYIVSRDRGVVRVMDIQDPMNPVELAALRRTAERQAFSATISGGALVIEYGRGDAEIVDIRDRSQPVGEAAWIGISTTVDVALEGETAWVLGENGSVWMLPLNEVRLDDRAQMVFKQSDDIGRPGCLETAGSRRLLLVQPTPGETQSAPSMVVLDRTVEDGVVEIGRLTFPVSFSSKLFNGACDVEYIEQSEIVIVSHSIDGWSWRFIVDLSDPEEPELLTYSRNLSGLEVIRSDDQSFDTFGRTSGVVRWEISTLGTSR